MFEVSETYMIFPEQEKHRAAAAQMIIENYFRIFGERLVEGSGDVGNQEMLDCAPFVVLSAMGNFGSDHVFNYANRHALELFEYRWDELIGKPSSLSAELVQRNERRKLLDEVGQKGFIRNYSGIRISQTGKRFRIVDATVFNLVDSEGVYMGQAAVFSQWIYLK